MGERAGDKGLAAGLSNPVPTGADFGAPFAGDDAIIGLAGVFLLRYRDHLNAGAKVHQVQGAGKAAILALRQICDCRCHLSISTVSVARGQSPSRWNTGHGGLRCAEPRP